MSTIPVCPHCGSSSIQPIGYTDGGGDYGQSIEMLYQCDDCEEQFAIEEAYFTSVYDEGDLE